MINFTRFFSSQMTLALICRMGLVLAISYLSSCSSAPKSEVVISVKDQKLGVYSEGHLKKQFTISTSKFGLGDTPGSCRTPLGKHEVIAKIGHGLPAGAVLKSRSWNGEVLKPNAPGRDPIVSRIMWLRGMESGNRNAMKRYIYIHGTPEENRLGTPASYGCIRMGMKDVVEAFNDIGIGAKVVVTRGRLPLGKKEDAPQPTLEAGVVIAQKKSDAEVPVAIPVTLNKADTAAAQVKTKKKVGPEVPDAKPSEKSHAYAKPIAKSKKTAGKPEKITTSSRHRVAIKRAHC